MHRNAPLLRRRRSARGHSWVAAARSTISRRAFNHRSSGSDKAGVANHKSIGLAAISIAPLLWPIY